MQLSEHILTKNDCYRAGRTITPKGIMVHSTGVAQPDVEIFLAAWNQPGVEKCAHAFVHRDGVTETLPWNWRGWHAGTPPEGGISANHTHISFEILEPSGHTYSGGEMVGYDAAKNAAYFEAVYRNAVDLCVYLCARYHLDPLTDIVDHAEGYAQNIASNHSDVGQWFPKHGKSMDLFRADVKHALKGGDSRMTQEQFNAMFANAMADYQARQQTRPVSDWAATAWKRASADGIFDGSMPGAPLTREQAALVLDRLNLIE